MNPTVGLLSSLRSQVVFLVLVALLVSRAIGAPDTKPPSPTPTSTPVKATGTGPIYASFDTFRIIDERNIFDPNRVGQVARSANDQPRGDTITLVGTMHYEKGLFAFFDGSNASFQKALHETETIAQYTVTHIANDGVELMRDGQRLSLKIGQQLQRPVGGDWSVMALDTTRNEIASTSNSDVTTPSIIPPDAPDTLKRLMEQRQKQLRQ